MALINSKNCTMGELVDAIEKSKLPMTANFYVIGQHTEYYGFSAKKTKLEGDVVLFGIDLETDGDTVADLQKWCKDNHIKRYHQVVFNGFVETDFPYVEGWLSIKPDKDFDKTDYPNGAVVINVDYWPTRRG